MKILSFGILYFHLPDDFDGGFPDALRALADYHESVAGTPKQEIGEPKDFPPELTVNDHEEKIWNEFWDVVHTSDRRVHGMAGLTIYDSNSGKLRDLELNTGDEESQ